MGKVVGIIGAGISGLLACKYTLEKGLNPMVFESQAGLGGVWTNTPEITKLQTPKGLYQFSDFPWDNLVVPEELPGHNQVLTYINAYADNFGLREYIKFNSKVLKIEFKDGEVIGDKWNPWGNGKWNIFAKGMVYEVDFVILCIGRYSGEPNIPEFVQGQGPEVFINGRVMHSIEYSSLRDQDAVDLVSKKRVTVVGMHKSGIDIATECSNRNGTKYPCTIICRNQTPQWHFKDYNPRGFPLAYLYFNRFAELMLHKPGEGLLLSLLATMLSPLRWTLSKFVESDIKGKLELERHGMLPEQSFQQSLYYGSVTIVPNEFYHNVNQESIVIKKSPTFCFNQHGLLLESEPETTLETDLVIFATGFNGQRKLRNIFASRVYQDYITTNSPVPLYRDCIHPRIPQLCIIGISDTFSNLYTTELRCRWLAELLNGTFELPDIGKMEEDVDKNTEFLNRCSGMYDGRCVGGVHIWYNDQLCKDMRWNPNRKKGFFAEWFQPYGPLDYAQI